MLEYLNGLLQPWRRVPRLEFVTALTVLSVPGLALMLGGLLEGGLGVFGPLLQAREAMGGLEGLPLAVSAPATPAANPGAAGLDVAGVLNGLCLLLLTPFLRGRLLDMGWPTTAASLGAIALQASVLLDLLRALSGLTWPWALALQGLTLVGYLALSLLGSRARPPVHQRMGTPVRRDDDDFPRF